MTQALADMRRDYTRDGLSEAQAPSEPFALFHQWFADAVKTEQPPVEANAMTLATVDQDGRPHCRILFCPPFYWGPTSPGPPGGFGRGPWRSPRSPRRRRSLPPTGS